MSSRLYRTVNHELAPDTVMSSPILPPSGYSDRISLLTRLSPVYVTGIAVGLGSLATHPALPIAILVAAVIGFFCASTRMGIVNRQIIIFGCGVLISGPRIIAAPLGPPIAPPEGILTGRIANFPQIGRQTTRLMLNVTAFHTTQRATPMAVKVRIVVHDNCDSLLYGDYLAVAVSKVKVSPRLTDHRNQPTYQTTLASCEQLLPLLPPPSPSLLRWIDRQRMLVRHRVLQHLDNDSIDVLLAMTIGDSSRLNHHIRDDFAITGLAHLLAISGLHLGIIAWFCFAATKQLVQHLPKLIIWMPAQQIAAAFTLALTNLFALLAGMTPPVLRSTIMVSTFLIAMLINRRTSTWHNLSLAGWIILTIWPSALALVSFQLSFTAVASTLVAHQSAAGDRIRSISTKSIKYLLLVALTSAYATVATAPLLIWHFQRFSPAAILANIIGIPLYSIVIAPSLMTCLAMILALPTSTTIISHLVIEFAMSAVSILLRFNQLVANLFSDIGFWLQLPQWFAVPVCLIALIVLIPRRPGAHWLAAKMGLCSLIAAGSLVVTTLHSRPEMIIDYINVGHGDSALISDRYGNHILIDTGGQDGLASFRPQADLWDTLTLRHVDAVRLVLLSHPHLDHFGGLEDIIDHLPINEIIANSDVGIGSTWDALTVKVAAKKIRWTSIEHSAESRAFGDLAIDIFPPLLPKNEDNFNQRSLVAKVSYRNYCALFSGDIDQEAEKHLLALIPALRCELLKVPHHGSATSSSPAFINAVCPAQAIISAGHRPGLPAVRTLGNYLNAGVRLWITPYNGTITAKLHQQMVTVTGHKNKDPLFLPTVKQTCDATTIAR